jgi:hypothetical protein
LGNFKINENKKSKENITFELKNKKQKNEIKIFLYLKKKKLLYK